MKYEHIVAEVFRKPWAILPEKFAVIAQLVALRASGARLTEDEIHARLEAAAISAGPRSQQSYGAVSVIPVRGMISHRANLMSQVSGGTSVERLTSQFRAALADASVKAIVFDVDSPGGSVEGVPELAEEIYKSRGQKKTIAVANSMAASAAYWIASAASELVIAPSGQVGSIGVFMAHEDLSKALDQEGVKVTLVSAGKYKTEGNEFEPLSDSARAGMQEKVDAFYAMFVKSVARARRASQDDVRGGFGQGRMELATKAVKEGMADRVATMDETLAKLGAGDGSSVKLAAAADAAGIRADDGSLEEAECACACDACRADDCESCSNELCADPNCAHPPRGQAAARQEPDPKLDIERRRRELDLL
ncbi:MAG: S49 family peptidase [Candidatus Acidiferrales bacterium]